MTTPGYDKYEVEKRFLAAIQVQDIDKVFPDPKGKNAIPPPPNPKIVVETMKIEIKKLELQLKTKLEQAKLMSEFELNKAKINELEAKAEKEKAEANGVQTGHQLQAMQLQISATKNHQEGLLKAMEILNSIDKEMSSVKSEGADNQGGVSGMGDPSGN
jgi:hypothetical protein